MFTVDAPSERGQADPTPRRRLTVPSGPYARRPGDDDDDRTAGGRRGVPAPLAVAGLASLGAGAIHATAAGAHGEHRATAVAFVAVALAQLAWGAYALVRSNRLVTFAGAALNAAAVGGWVLAKTSGISFVDGLEEAESAQFADSVAAALGGVAVVGALVALGARRGVVARPRPWLSGVAALAVVGLTVPAMVQTGGHSHAGGEQGHDGAGHAAATPPVPYMGTKPVDLGGVPGVTAEEQARAEALVEESIDVLPQFADVDTLNEKGYYSIGDAVTGDEHFINWNLINDGVLLDPSKPESLVFQPQPDGSKKLAAAMFMMPDGSSLDEVPELGGPLTQWHIHDDLCFNGDPVAGRLVSITSVGGSCPPGTSKFDPAPMIHVWIQPHPCGPFAALEGIGGGQIAAGETRLCDTAHGHGG